MTYQLYKWSLLALLPTLTIGCSADLGSADTEENDTEEFRAADLSNLPGSDFEIDKDANLKMDSPDGLQPAWMDWANVTQSKRDDKPSGKKDNSYTGGSKEDDVCPGTGTGSIPNNKSDIKTFGVYQEGGSKGFLHLYWARVQDPSGTTLIDFEFNQSETKCNELDPGDPHYHRTAGDLLLEYRLEQGGASATIKKRVWDGAKWADAEDLTGVLATGTINSKPIPQAESDGLGSFSARTFGEASIDLEAFFGDTEKCISFGSAFVKSRSADAFDSALKDFSPPIDTNISNCGRVIIKKEVTPDNLNESFGFTHTMKTDPASPATFSLGDGEEKSFTNVLLGNGYTVTEDESGSGFELASIVCEEGAGYVKPTIDEASRSVTFDIQDENDIVECTFYNEAKGNIVIEKISVDGAAAFEFSSNKLGGFPLQTTGPGSQGKALKTFNDLDAGNYDVSEAASDGWVQVSATCNDGSDPSNIGLGAGETVTCTFTNRRQRGAIRIVKTRDHAALGAGPYPHGGVTFLISGGDIVGPPKQVVTDNQGVACLDDLLLSSVVGDYVVTEQVPPGYREAGALAKPVTVTGPASCPNGGNQVLFHNIPLSDITMIVNSQIDGGTLSKITCQPMSVVANNNGDGSLGRTNLLPDTYTCQVVISSKNQP